MIVMHWRITHGKLYVLHLDYQGKELIMRNPKATHARGQKSTRPRTDQDEENTMCCSWQGQNVVEETGIILHNVHRGSV